MTQPRKQREGPSGRKGQESHQCNQPTNRIERKRLPLEPPLDCSQIIGVMPSCCKAYVGWEVVQSVSRVWCAVASQQQIDLGIQGHEWGA